MSTETTARLTGAEGSWPQSVAEPAAPIAPPRRSTATEEPWLPPEPTAPRARQVPADSLTGLAAELSSKFGAPEIAATREPMSRDLREPMPRTTAAPTVAPSLPETPPSPQSDRNLAEMAQQLEAALRRSPNQDSRPPVTDALAVPPTAKVSSRAPARDIKPRQEPKFEAKFDPKFDSKFESKYEPKREPKFEPKFEAKPEAPTTPDKNIYDNLEEEMASLLGRPPEKS
jgi:hypothetical protein